MNLSEQAPKILIEERIRNHSIADIHYIKDLLDALPFGEYSVMVTKKPIRTLSLNAYYWGVIIKRIHDYTGELELTIHKELKKRFNPRGYIKNDGDMMVFGGSTRKENDERFWLYCLKCMLYALEEFNIDIPYPDKLSPEERLQAAKYEQKNSK